MNVKRADQTKYIEIENLINEVEDALDKSQAKRETTKSNARQLTLLQRELDLRDTLETLKERTEKQIIDDLYIKLQEDLENLQSLTRKGQKDKR